MSYKNDSYLVIMNSYDKANGAAKAELFETYDRIRDLASSGPALGGNGLGKFSGLLVNVARMFGASNFLPTFGNESINIPGTSYYAPITGGTGIIPGGQAAFGLAPFSQVTGYNAGGAAPVDNSAVVPLSSFSAYGTGSMNASSLGFSGVGDPNYPASAMVGGMTSNAPSMLSGGTIAGGASPVTALASNDLSGGSWTGGASGLSSAATAGGMISGTAAGAGFGRNWVMPAAGVVSGIGGMLTTLGPFLGPFGIAAAAGGAVANGLAGAVLSSFQKVSTRLLTNADTILAAKVKNLETTVKQLDAQEDIIKKLLKDQVDGDKKALDNL